MSLPKPKAALENICAVIHNNVLYIYSTGALRSLALKEGAEWKTLANGEPVTGAVCVGSTPKDDSHAGLYLVGGQATSPEYRGLQKFTYSTGKWESITPQDPVTQNRLLHGAAYLPASDQIVIYGGNQDGSKGPSTQTFVVGASAPYNTLAFSSSAAPVVNPILLTWSDTQAVLVGGSSTNNRVMLFSPDHAWSDSGATLAEPLQKDKAAVQAVLLRGDDGSKSLYTFDFSTMPVDVKRIVLVDASGAPVVNSPTISKLGTRDMDSEFEKRALTLANWPAYNGTLAPQHTRLNYAVAQSPEGLVVFAGGSGPDNADINIFNARENRWEDPAQKLGQQATIVSGEPPMKPAPSRSATASASASASAPASPIAPGPRSSPSSSIVLPAPLKASNPPSVPASTPVSASPAASHSSAAVGANTVLGIVLGTITGLMILLGLILFCIRCRRGKTQPKTVGAQDPRVMSPRGFPDEKAGLGYGNDNGTGQDGRFRGHHHQDSAGSFSSVAILMGKVNGNNAPKSSGVRGGNRRDASNSFFKRTIGKPIPCTNGHSVLAPPSGDEKGVSFAPDIANPRPAPRGAPTGRPGEPRRSSGWNRYWSGGSALNILGFGNSKRTTVYSDRSSRYSNAKNRATRDSATVPPLHIVTQDLSSTVPPIQQMSGKIDSSKEARRRNSSSSGYSVDGPEGARAGWDSTGPSKAWGADRAASSVYTDSVYPLSLAPSLPNQLSGIDIHPPLPTAGPTSDLSWLNLGEVNKKQDRR